VLGLETTVRPSDHVGLELRAERRWLDVAGEAGAGRLFTGHVAWMKATYSMNVRCFLRLIAQYERVRRSLPLYAVAVSENEGGLEASTLFGYRANWRTLLYLGYGQFRTLQPHGALGSPDRQLFFKLAYEFGGH
jgi:hypothetical protein